MEQRYAALAEVHGKVAAEKERLQRENEALREVGAALLAGLRALRLPIPPNLSCVWKAAPPTGATWCALPLRLCCRTSPLPGRRRTSCRPP